MKNFLSPIIGMMLLMLSVSRIWAQTTELTGETDPFYYNVPLSGLALVVMLLLIMLFLVWRYLPARKKTSS